MSEEQVTPKKKTPEERVEEIDRKIAELENKIDALKAKKEAILNPITYASVMQEAKKRKISPKKLAEIIDIQFPVEAAKKD